MVFDRTGSGSLLPSIKEILIHTKNTKRRFSDTSVDNNLHDPNPIDSISAGMNNVFLGDADSKPVDKTKNKTVKETDLVRNYIPIERFRPMRRMSEPGKPYLDCVSGIGTRNFSNDKSHELEKCFSKAMANSDKHKNKTMKVNTKDIYRWSRRMSAPIVSHLEQLSKSQSAVHASKSGLKNTISKRGTDSIKSARRTSLPDSSGTNSAQQHKMSLEGQATFLISKCGVEKPLANHKNYKQYVNLERRRVSLTDIPSVRTQIHDGNPSTGTHSKYHFETTSYKQTCHTFGDYRCKLLEIGDSKQVARMASRNKTSNPAVRSSQKLSVNIPKRRFSEPANNFKARFEPQLPTVSDNSFDGIDIQKWLQSSSPEFGESLDDIMLTDQIDDSESCDLGRQTRMDFDENQLRSVSQANGDYQDIAEGESDSQLTEVLRNIQMADKDALIRDIIGSCYETDTQVNTYRDVNEMQQ